MNDNISLILIYFWNTLVIFRLILVDYKYKELVWVAKLVRIQKMI